MPEQGRRPHRACRRCTSPPHWRTCDKKNWVRDHLIGADSTTPPKGVLPTEPWRQGPFLKGIVDGCGLFENVPKGDRHPPAKLSDEQAVRGVVCHLPPCWLTLVTKSFV